LNKRFNDLAEKALGKERASEITFKNLRDSYNEILLDSGIEQEIKDVLMMHKRTSAKSRYPVSVGTIIREFQEKVFPLISIDGWRLEGRAAKTEELTRRVVELEKALNQVEEENASYKTRINALHNNIEKNEEKWRIEVQKIWNTLRLGEEQEQTWRKAAKEHMPSEKYETHSNELLEKEIKFVKGEYKPKDPEPIEE